MFYIFNQRGLVDAYTWLCLLQSHGVQKSNQTVRDLKQSIRNYNKRPSRPHIINNKNDEWIEVILLPERITSSEEAIDYFHNHLEEVYIPLPYDCTVQKFTRDYLIHKRSDGRFVCYHTVVVDV